MCLMKTWLAGLAVMYIIGKLSQKISTGMREVMYTLFNKERNQQLLATTTRDDCLDLLLFICPRNNFNT